MKPNHDEPVQERSKNGARGRLLVLALVLGTIALHALAFSNIPLIPKNDSVLYLGQTHAVSAERVQDPFAPGEPVSFDVIYPLGYPLFLDLVLLLFGWDHLTTGVLLIQHLAGIAAVLCVYRIGVRLGRPAAGLLAAAAYALYFPAVHYGHVMISESLFGAASLSSVVLVLRGAGSGSTGVLLLAGVAAGAASLLRSVALAQVAFLMAFLLFAGRAQFRTGIWRAACFASPVILLVAGMLLHNAVWFGRATPSDATGRHLVDRIWAYDRIFDERDPASRRILEYCQRSGVRYELPGFWWDSFKALRFGSNLSASEADRLMARAAVATILSHLPEYVANTPAALWQLMSREDQWIPPLKFHNSKRAFERYLANWTRVPPDMSRSLTTRRDLVARQSFLARTSIAMPSGSPAGRALLTFWETHSPRHAALTSLGALGAALLLLRLGRGRDLVLVAMVVATLMPAALLEYPFARYRQPAIPFLLLLLASALVELARRLSATRRDMQGTKSATARSRSTEQAS